MKKGPFVEEMLYIYKMTDTSQFPMIFGLNGKSFEWVFINKKEWVDFVITEMKDATGIFKVFKQYCKKKIEQEKRKKKIK